MTTVGGYRDEWAFYPDLGETRVHRSFGLDSFTLMPGLLLIFRSHLLRQTDNDYRPSHLLNVGSMARDTCVLFLAVNIGCVATVSESLALYRQRGSI